jgi:putative glycosyltransferase (TIGR04372 family)
MGVTRYRNASTDDPMARGSLAVADEDRVPHLTGGPAVGGPVNQTHATDVTDDQWHDLCAAVFPPPHPAGDLRPVLNALLYRERSYCPWRLLPPGFPPADLIRPLWQQWQKDGTWKRVRAIVTALPPPKPRQPLTALGRLRQQGARLLKQVPGGELVLLPGRQVIRLVEWVGGWFSVYAKLPGWFREGARLAEAREYEAAVGFYSRVIRYDPKNVPTHVRRAYANLRCGRLDDACADCYTILALPAATMEDIIQAHYYLSEALVLSGDVDRGVDHAVVARLLSQQEPGDLYGTLDEWEDGGLIPGPDEFEVMATAHNDLAEHVINTKSDFATAAELYQRWEGFRQRYARWLDDIPDRTLFLSEDWVRNIGHMALIDFWVKMDRMGWRAWDRKVLLAPPKAVANAAYVDYYGTFFKLIRAARVPNGIRHLTATFGPRVASLIALPDGSRRYFTEGMGLVQEAWEREGRGPLLELTDADLEFGRKALRAMGVPDGAWFVSLHARSSGFHKEGKGFHQSHRNAAVRDYLPAAREIARRGGWVIRLGDKSMEKLPPNPGVIDYAHSPYKSPRMDLFLCGACRFYVGGASGLSHVPTTFGVPCVLTNWLSNALPVYSRRDLFVLKLLRSVEEDRLLTFDEYLCPETRLLCYSGAELHNQGYEVVDNSPDELRDVVTEMMDQLDRPEADAGVDPLVAAFDALARGHGLAGFSRVGRSFVAEHRWLLPAAPVRRSA